MAMYADGLVMIPARFEYGWQVIRGVDGHDATEVETALKTARQETSRPTLICCRTVIGFGSPNLAGSERPMAPLVMPRFRQRATRRIGIMVRLRFQKISNQHGMQKSRAPKHRLNGTIICQYQRVSRFSD